MLIPSFFYNTINKQKLFHIPFPNSTIATAIVRICNTIRYKMQTRKPANPQTRKPANPQTRKPANPQTRNSVISATANTTFIINSAKKITPISCKPGFSHKSANNLVPLEKLYINPSLLKTIEQRIAEIGDPQKIIGTLIASGYNGNIYQCKFDDQLVIKQDHKQGAMDRLEKEALCFNSYYGIDSAAVVILNKLPTLVMTKINGTVLEKLTQENAPKNLTLLTKQMLTRLKSCNIFHSDLHMGNLIYNPLHDTVYPIDISNGIDNNLSQEFLDMIEEELLCNIQDLVENNEG